MKWIKASDRQPENWNKVIIRNTETQKGIVDFDVSSGYIIDQAYIPAMYVSADKVEWLDETPAATQQVKTLSHFLRWIRDKHSVKIHDMIIQDYMMHGIDETPINLDAIISEVEDIHPYKQSGNHESYSQYNEGWADACDILGNRIRKALGLPKSEQSTLSPNEYIENLIRQAGGTWKDVDVQKYLDMVKGRKEMS